MGYFVACFYDIYLVTHNSNEEMEGHIKLIIMKNSKNMFKRGIILLFTIVAISFSSVIELNADERCERTGYYDGPYEPFFTGWCWAPEGVYLGHTTECPAGTGSCINWDCSAACDWIPIPNPD